MIEAIALGHDIGHTPFGRAGEEFLDELLFEHIGRHFSHNTHSVRVLDKIFPYNISLQTLNGVVCPIMRQMYERLLSDLTLGKNDSPIFTHHIDYVNKAHYKREIPYEQTEPNQIMVDYIASMTDDYFTDLYAYLFPESELNIIYKGYFE